jgi:hypothetical protein
MIGNSWQEKNKRILPEYFLVGIIPAFFPKKILA